MERHEDQHIWWNFVYEEQTYKKEKIDMSNNAALLLAVCVSMVIAGTAGVGVGILVYLLLKGQSKKFWKKLEHMRRYRLIQEELAKRNTT